MYEEDRIRVLELYNDIFDETDNETAVLQPLVSPTRQAVNLARAYDTRGHGYQEGEGTPGYLQVIEQLRTQAQALSPAAPKLDSDQISLFEKDDQEQDPLDRLGIRETNAPAPLPEEINSFPDEDKDTARLAPPAPPAAPVQAEEKPTAQEQNIDEFADAVDAFLADFKINDDALAPDTAVKADAPAEKTTAEWDRPGLPDQDAETEAWLHAPAAANDTDSTQAPAVIEQQPPVTQEEPAEKPAPSVRREASAESEKPAAQRTKRVAVTELPDLPDEPEREPNVPLLILFVVLAIPIGLLGAALIISLACASLSVGAALLGGAIVGFGAAFTAFSVFADILLVFGLSLAAAAFSLLFFWIFVWLLIGVLPDMVRGIFALARKLCYKEVRE